MTEFNPEEANFQLPRNSRMSLGNIYFWTDTIKDWKHLLKKDAYKKIITEQLQWLVKKKKVRIYGYVIMPNHIHLLWEMVEPNGGNATCIFQ
ncbi:MAG: transposase [Bacteroidota bacterium]